ncbi:MarR family winged helix-turn-helix transcriptional regulator [Pseudonocardia dioxanivorans]|uniref:MarR family winged helix-turn-helix transcriptional regulator n=1 Tax=Pseudonocardia dioxanivorans TaxID=240495 RepID=UPI001F1ADF55|nr:MarR family winged helix-turn-helix transcriptional regulator [Pseudonocardia dioxanivorans]
MSRPGSDQRSISDTTFLAPSMLPAIVNRLDRRELIVITRNPTDGRRVHLSPTSAAVALMYEIAPRVVAGNTDLLARLPAGRRDRFLAALRAVGLPGLVAPSSRHHIPSPDGLRPALEIPWGLGRMARSALRRHGRLWAAAIDSVTHLQWLALTALAQGNDMDQRVLGGEIDVDKATASVMVGRLAAHGLVAKSIDSWDRRRRVIKLTDRGRRLVLDLDDRARAVDEALLEPLAKSRRGDFVRDLRQLASGTLRG